LSEGGQAAAAVPGIEDLNELLRRTEYECIRLALERDECKLRAKAAEAEAHALKMAAGAYDI
jgi:hypothetical protein